MGEQALDPWPQWLHSGPAKHCWYLRTNFVPGDTFWLRAVHECSSLGSDPGVLQPISKDGDLRSLTPEQMLESIQPRADVQGTGRGWRLELRGCGVWAGGSHCLEGLV